MDKLLEKGNPEYLYRAGTLWREFDFKAAWRFMEQLVSSGEEWRGLAFENPRWKGELKKIWEKALSA